MSEPCYAPVFEGSSALGCLFINIFYALLLIVLLILIILTFGSDIFVCRFRQVAFRMQHCREGNHDRNIDLSGDAYERHIRAYKEQFGKSAEWEQWMLDNRDRYQNAFNKASEKPATLDIAFRYDTDPIAYSPPWASEAEHMLVLEALAQGAYAGYDFQFIFNGDTVASYGNVIAGIPTNSSHASGKNVYLYYEAIFNHEFAHVMAIRHHYDTDDQTGDGLHMPPGESQCIMDRNNNQFCSACRTALHIPLDVDNDAAITAAVSNIASRYPY